MGASTAVAGVLLVLLPLVAGKTPQQQMAMF
jgi:hypothetical protein